MYMRTEVQFWIQFNTKQFLEYTVFYFLRFYSQTKFTVELHDTYQG